MTINSKATIKTFFQTGDTPSQAQFEDLIDSFVGLGENSVQTIPSAVTVSGATSLYGANSFYGTNSIIGATTVSGATGLYGDISLGVSAASTMKTALSLGTAAFLDVGTTANKIVQLNGSAQLPAVDGSLLTNVNSGAVTLISTQTASNSATIDFTSGIDATYTHYILEISNLIPVTNNVNALINMQQGGTFSLGSAYYITGSKITTGAVTTYNTTAGTSFVLSSGTLVANGDPHFIIFEFFNPAVLNALLIKYYMNLLPNSSQPDIFYGAGSLNSILATTGIQFLFSSGNISTGTFKLYGMK